MFRCFSSQVLSENIPISINKNFNITGKNYTGLYSMDSTLFNLLLLLYSCVRRMLLSGVYLCTSVSDSRSPRPVSRPVLSVRLPLYRSPPADPARLASRRLRSAEAELADLLQTLWESQGPPAAPRSSGSWGSRWAEPAPRRNSWRVRRAV